MLAKNVQQSQQAPQMELSLPEYRGDYLIEFTACIVTIRRDNPVCDGSVLIRTAHANAICRMVFSFRQGFANGFVMSDEKARVSPDHGLNKTDFGAENLRS
jgi:hypothetical protein